MPDVPHDEPESARPWEARQGGNGRQPGSRPAPADGLAGQPYAEDGRQPCPVRHPGRGLAMLVLPDGRRAEGGPLRQLLLRQASGQAVLPKALGEGGLRVGRQAAEAARAPGTGGPAGRAWPRARS
jgi:hypothetical protein